MTAKNIDYSSKLIEVHNKLVAQFQDNKQDIKTAEALEKFLNYVIYPEKNSTFPQNKQDSDIAAVLTEELAIKLRKDNKLKKLFTGENASDNISNLSKGDMGEEAFARALYKIIKNASQKRMPTMKKSLENVIIGNAQATVLIDGFREEAEKEINKQLQAGKKISLSNYTQFGLRKGKVDIDMQELKITADLNSFAKELLNITASVKNYSNFSIHLEDLNRKKAIQAIMSENGEFFNNEDINNLLTALSEDVEMQKHINHISYLYALTGYGQTYIFKNVKNTKAKLEKQYAKFLMYNNAKAQIIKVKSTNEIIKNMLEESSAYGTAFSSRLKSDNIHYETRLRLDK